MPKAVTREEVVRWLEKNSNHIQLITYGGSANKTSLWLNKKTQNLFSYRFTSLKKHIKNGRNVGGGWNLKLAKEWLDENIPEIKIVEWCGATQKSKFYDKNKKINFDYSFAQLRSFFEKNNNFRPNRNIEEVIQVRQKTMLKRYGVCHPSQDQEIHQKSIQTKIKKGILKTHNKKLMSDIAQSKGIPYTTFQQRVKKHGFENALKIQKKKTSIEFLVENILIKNNISYEYDYRFGPKLYRPDFVIPDNNLIIECNGLYWHSDAINDDKKYHKKKKNFYNKKGYDSLFFREDEINEKILIVESLILNKLKKNNRIFARNTFVSSCNKDFFVENHLMGKGQGRIFALKDKNTKRTIAAMQVKWKNKKDKILEISRFCTKNNISVVGGFSKLTKEVSNKENPNKIITFIDKRYGDGSYLLKLGWIQKTNNLSFVWVDRKKSYHRMKFPGNSGYNYGLNKMWDCGQVKYEWETV